MGCGSSANQKVLPAARKIGKSPAQQKLETPLGTEKDEAHSESVEGTFRIKSAQARKSIVIKVNYFGLKQKE